MWVYYLTPGTWREIDEGKAAGRFFGWAADNGSGAFLVLLRAFVSASEHHGGLGGITESDDDLIDLYDAIMERIAQLP